ncbi:hypothetical protein HK102_008148 [Quaeritorhiza haematococci]|nr:hypothetical protein HK102_008148 [Quaeritorhiza haematococci]
MSLTLVSTCKFHTPLGSLLFKRGGVTGGNCYRTKERLTDKSKPFVPVLPLSGYVCMFKKSLFETYHKNDFETFILVLKWLTRDWSVSSVAEFVIKMFYNWKVDSEKFGTVVGRMVEDWDEEWKEIHENEEAIRGTRDHEEGFRPRASSFGSTETLTNATPSTISNGGGSTDQPQRTGKRKQDSLVNLLLVGEKPDAIARFMMHYTGFGKCWCHLYSEAGRRADGYVCEYHFHEGSSRSKGRKEGEPKARIWLPEDVLAFVKRLAKYSGWSETVLSSFVMEFKQLLNTTMINLPPPPRPSRQRLQNPISTSEDLELRLNNLSMVDDETSEMGNNVWYDFLADALTFYI